MKQDVKKYETILSETMNMVSDHKVLGKCVIPGAVFLMLASAYYENGSIGMELVDVTLSSPMIIENMVPKTALTTFEQQGNRAKFRVTSGGETESLHAVGFATELISGKPNALMLDEIRHRCNIFYDHDAFYKGYEDGGYSYRKYYRSVQNVTANQIEFISEIKASGARLDNKDTGILDPSVVDGALQSLGSIYYGDKSYAYLPAAFKRIKIYKFPYGKVYCYGRGYSDSTLNPLQLLYDIKIVDERGEILIDISHFALKRMAGAKDQIFNGREA